MKKCEPEKAVRGVLRSVLMGARRRWPWAAIVVTPVACQSLLTFDRGERGAADAASEDVGREDAGAPVDVGSLDAAPLDAGGSFCSSSDARFCEDFDDTDGSLALIDKAWTVEPAVLGLSIVNEAASAPWALRTLMSPDAATDASTRYTRIRQTLATLGGKSKLVATAMVRCDLGNKLAEAKPFGLWFRRAPQVSYLESNIECSLDGTIRATFRNREKTTGKSEVGSSSVPPSAAWIPVTLAIEIKSTWSGTESPATGHATIDGRSLDPVAFPGGEADAGATQAKELIPTLYAGMNPTTLPPDAVVTTYVDNITYDIE